YRRMALERSRGRNGAIPGSKETKKSRGASVDPEPSAAPIGGRSSDLLVAPRPGSALIYVRAGEKISKVSACPRPMDASTLWSRSEGGGCGCHDPPRTTLSLRSQLGGNHDEESNRIRRRHHGDCKPRLRR